MADIDYASVLRQMAIDGMGYFAEADINRLIKSSETITRLTAENERLRHALSLCRTELFHAAYYRGYEGGPLESPSVDLALQLAGDILRGEPDE